MSRTCPPYWPPVTCASVTCGCSILRHTGLTSGRRGGRSREGGAMFAVVGEALLDMVQPEPGRAFIAIPGGGPLNIAIGLKRLGHPTQMLARFPSGSLGGLVREHAESN